MKQRHFHQNTTFMRRIGSPSYRIFHHVIIIFLLFLFNKVTGELLASQQQQWPTKMSSCGLSQGWPETFMLVSKGSTVGIGMFEIEKTNRNNKLSLEVLIFAVSYRIPKSAKTSDLIRTVLPSLRCDFRKGSVEMNARYKPFARTPVEMIVLKEEGSQMTAKLICPLPDTIPSLLKIPGRKNVTEMDMQRVSHERQDWLHWQLHLSRASSRDNSWIGAPSVPLCRNSIQTNSLPNAAALCVTSLFGSPFGDWTTDSIRDWFIYQRELIGFSHIFAFDRFGERTSISKPETEVWIGKHFHNVPHTSLYRKVARFMRVDGQVVAETLLKERCSMLARQYGANYMLSVKDPMDLIVPLNHQPKYFRKVLRDINKEKHCKAQSVYIQQQSMSLKGENESIQNVSQFLLDGEIMSISSTKSTRLVSLQTTRTANDRPCPRKNATIPGDDMLFISNDSLTDTIRRMNTSIGNNTIQKTLGTTARWINQFMQRSNTSSWNEKHVSKFDAVWKQSPLSSETPVRMCHSTRDAGPTYGETVMILADGKVAKFTSFNAEVVSQGHLSPAYLSISVYAEDARSIRFSKHGSWAWGQLFQRQEAMPEVECVFMHPDPFERTRVPNDVNLRTNGTWIGARNVLFWLQCPLPETQPTPDKMGRSFLVTIEMITGSSPSNSLELHTVRPIQLCIGAEKETAATYDETKYCDEYSVACRVGCIDNLKNVTDPHARCCQRCHKFDENNDIFDEQKESKPLDASQHLNNPSNSESTTSSVSESRRISYGTVKSHGAPVKDFLNGKDLSLCLRPFFLETLCVECDGMAPVSPQRLIEWIEYHILIGFDVIYILDRDGESLLPILSRYIETGRVVHIPFPFLTDNGMGVAARDKLDVACFDQVMAYDYCMSIARRRKDAFMALIDTDEYIRYPEPSPGGLRTKVNSLLKEQWNSSDLPDQIALERFDVQVEHGGLALGYTKRTEETRKQKVGFHGKVLVRPDAMIHGAALVHKALNSSTTEDENADVKHLHGSYPLVANASELCIYHYREKDTRSWIIAPSTYNGTLVDDFSLQWAYKILASQLVNTMGWKSVLTLSEQGLLRKFRPRLDRPTQDENTTNAAVSAKRRPSIFIGILTECPNRDRRDAIRATWLSPGILKQVRALMDIQIKFALSSSFIHWNSKSCNSEDIKRENITSGDILVIKDDRGFFRTRTSIQMIRWASNNVDADFVLKIDDDSYLNLPSLVETLLQVEDASLPLYFRDHHTFSRSMNLSSESERSRSCKTPDNASAGMQPNCPGSRYILSHPLVQRLGEKFDKRDTLFKKQSSWKNEKHIDSDAVFSYLLRGDIDRSSLLSWPAMDALSVDLMEHNCFEVFDTTMIHLNAPGQSVVHKALRSELATNLCELRPGFGVDHPKGEYLAEKMNDTRADKNEHSLVMTTSTTIKNISYGHLPEFEATQSEPRILDSSFQPQKLISFQLWVTAAVAAVLGRKMFRSLKSLISHLQVFMLPRTRLVK